MKSRTFLWTETGAGTQFEPTTIRALQRDERFLEDCIAQHPEILGLDEFARGIRGPYHVVQQAGLQTPTGHGVQPDILLVSASAHLFVVEVKLEDNPELRDRRVIAQIVEYAAGVAALDERGLTELLGDTAGTSGSLAELAAAWFPDECDDPDEFASVLLRRCREGEIDLVVACDRCPPGLREFGDALDRQHTLAFRLQVVEVEPWTAKSEAGRILFLNRLVSQTRIVARTHVSIAWSDPSLRPAVTVTTTPLAEIEDSLNAARDGSRRRDWKLEQVREEIAATPGISEVDRTTALKLLAFATERGGPVRFSDKPTVRPDFYFTAAPPGSSERPWIIWYVEFRSGRTSLAYLYLDTIRDLLPAGEIASFERRTSAWRRGKGPYLTRPLADLASELPAFFEMTLWIREHALAAGDRPSG